MRNSLVLGTLLAATVICAQQRDEWIIVPGRSVGPITPQTTRSDLDRIFGPDNVHEQMVNTGGDEEPVPATVVKGNDASVALTVFWNKHVKEGDRPPDSALPVIIRICEGGLASTKSCKWHLPDGISFGTSLRKLESLNRKVFRLYGFGWDYSGTVFDWNHGRLDDVLSRCGRTLIRLEPDDSDKPASPTQQAIYNEVSGDYEFASDNPAMKYLDPKIYSISVEFPENPSDCSAAGRTKH